ncbi:heavy metal translocating P-type ATPase [Marinitenerispora sediminis]|uniref:Heavy metal translocating P-type ATPase n=1 Tax=Marinitenerispora sediminis TaxID=1931232 RepID=A0A368SZH2_9ACTN|nr:heavy metal translocating P-type ATPase [Marinitenerispora sediminis]RCV48679.1 heavy metal translocating P-type ATPase [Marinitenerispora sediminis]RCV49192.1 heavy metal translocating P-type ATPase [Marinitenerispora sediminis]RCV51231.1 heavy metal translocating P-type ATPase [Marinitenerispora sediminis]
MTTSVAGERRAPGRGAPLPRHRTPLFALAEARWAAAALALFAVAAAAHAAGAPAWLYWSLYLACYAAGGWEPAWAGLCALRERSLDVDLLMVVAAAGAAAIGQVFDGALLIIIFATSGALEALATRRTEDSVRGLLALAPERGTRLLPDGGEEPVAAVDLAVGDELLVRPGERIAADGEVLDGGSEVDQATITGEAMPVAKFAGDEVFAGTMNGSGTLRVRVGRPAHDSVVARIVAMVERASATKARTQLFIERFEQRYSVGVVAATIALFTVPLLFGADLESALLRAMTFMIVASPCAVVLATMPPLLAAMANAGRHGVLVKNAVVLERLADTSVVALDKTGTLTEGRPAVAEVRVTAPGALSEAEVLRLAAAVERGSEHPLAGAVVAAAAATGAVLPPASGFAARPGRGVTATVEGHRVDVGALERLAPDAAGHPATAAAIAEVEARGHTAVTVLRDGAPVAVLGIRDTVRADAAAAVRGCAALTSAPPVLLTGDNPRSARRVAEEVGITDVRAGLLPEDKVAAVRALAERGERVVVVGDGVNDAPALAAAHAGIAMGGAGSDVALETADAVVVRDELPAVPAVVALARRARRLVIANLVIAGTVIVVLVTWDIVGTLPLPLGVAGHEGSTILVALNGLRLLREKAWTTAAQAGQHGEAP